MEPIRKEAAQRRKGGIEAVLLRHYAGRPDWITAERMRGWFQTGRAKGVEQRAIRETFQTVDRQDDGEPWEIPRIVEEEELDPAKTRELLIRCDVTNEKILRWLDEEADRLRQKADKGKGEAASTSTRDRSRSQPLGPLPSSVEPT